MSTFISSCVLLLTCFLQVTVSANPLYGDATVILYKDAAYKKQLNLYLGDQFLVDVFLRRSGLDEYVDINHLIVSQSVKGVHENNTVTFELERIENYLFNVTNVYPVHEVGGSSQTVVSASAYRPFTFLTSLEVSNSRNTTLSNSNILRIVLNSYRIVTNSGIQVNILPFH
ncbi:hypothetical protein WDU94_010942 [Cyamophila willieti]